MPLGYFLMANWRKLVLICAILLIAAPFVLLHLFVFAAKLFEPRLKGADRQSISPHDQPPIVFYRRDLTNRAHLTIVFIHGSPANAAAFHRQFADPFPGATLVAYDRPGFGKSALGSDSSELVSQVRSLGAVLDAIAQTNCILVGHSYGAAVALQTALERTNHVKGVILVGGSIDPSLERTTTLQKIAAWPIIRALLPAPLRNCNAEIMALKQGLENLRPQLASLGIPIVMVHGGKDRLVPISNVDYLERELVRNGKGGLLVPRTYPTDDHFIPWERPDRLTKAVKELEGRVGE